MKRWVVTGPAGAGKSSLCSLLADRGAAVLDGDALGHEILQWEDTVERIATEFGDQVVDNGRVNRTALGKIVFQDPSALKNLNRITHGSLTGLVSRRLDEIEATRRYRLAVLDAAVYFLLPPVPGIDLVVTVTAAEEIRIRRLTDGGVLDLAQATARVHAQRVMADGWDQADLVLANDGSTADLERAAGLLWERLEDEICPGTKNSGVEKRIPPEGAKDS